MFQKHIVRSRTLHNHNATIAKRKPTMPVSMALHPAFRGTESEMWNGLVTRTGGIFNPIAADLLDVARLLFLADGQVMRPRSWTRNLKVQMSVRQELTWQRDEVRQALYSLLKYISGDDWEIQFQPCSMYFSDVQPCLSFFDPFRVCLMSEGLDSLSGLARQLDSDNETKFLAVTGLTQPQVHGRVRKTITALNVQYSNRVNYVPVPLYRSKHAGQLKGEPSQRTRSFLLLALGAVVALMTGQRSVDIYENGIEMFNFPLAPCLRPELLSRAMHPTVLALMAKFVSTLIDAPFEFTAPFVFSTKGEMVCAIRETVPKDMILRTVSCIHFPQRKQGGSQCGVCSGCVLRRVSLHFAGILEEIGVYQSDFVSAIYKGAAVSPIGVKWQKIYKVDQEVCRLQKCLNGDAPDRSLMQLTGLNHSAQNEMLKAAASVSGMDSEHVMSSLIRLYSQYSQEWKMIRPSIGILRPSSTSEHLVDKDICVV